MLNEDLAFAVHIRTPIAVFARRPFRHLPDRVCRGVQSPRQRPQRRRRGPLPILPAVGPAPAPSGPAGGAAERIRCNASYRPRGSSQHEIDLQLRCASDSYNFDLSGQFTADEKNQITGRWTERSRNVGGTAIGNAQGDRLDIHVESSAFSADMVMVTRNRRQAVTIDSQGGGQIIKASISLSRNCARRADPARSTDRCHGEPRALFPDRRLHAGAVSWPASALSIGSRRSAVSASARCTRSASSSRYRD